MRGKIDLNDAVVSPFFVLASGVEANLFTLDLFGVDFSSALFVLGSGADAVSVSLANIVAILAISVAFATNRPKLSEMAPAELWVAIATVSLVVAPPFVPFLNETIQSTAIVGLVVLVIQAGGFYTLSYLG